MIDSPASTRNGLRQSMNIAVLVASPPSALTKRPLSENPFPKEEAKHQKDRHKDGNQNPRGDFDLR
jgi:hypothetical protein